MVLCISGIWFVLLCSPSFLCLVFIFGWWSSWIFCYYYYKFLSLEIVLYLVLVEKREMNVVFWKFANTSRVGRAGHNRVGWVFKNPCMPGMENPVATWCGIGHGVFWVGLGGEWNHPKNLPIAIPGWKGLYSLDLHQYASCTCPHCLLY